MAKYLVMEYFATSHKTCHIQNEYTRNILWNGMEYIWRFLFAQVRRLIYSLANVVGYTNVLFFQFCDGVEVAIIHKII